MPCAVQDAKLGPQGFGEANHLSHGTGTSPKDGGERWGSAWLNKALTGSTLFFKFKDKLVLHN